MRPEALDSAALARNVAALWKEDVLPSLVEYVRIPCCSPAFAPEWRESGHLVRAAEHVAAWCRERRITGLRVQLVQHDGRTPLVFVEAPGTGPATVLLYGHLDKQPAMDGWRAGLGPWSPVLENGRLYGRGGADDGYAAYAALAALEALEAQGADRPRTIVLIEATEESGSTDLPAYLEHLAAALGEPELVVCLDAGCGDYERLWCTTSLRGSLVLDLAVRVLAEPLHSGDGGGLVPDSFRVLRCLLSRLEEEGTGCLRLPELAAEIPLERVRQAELLAKEAGDLAQRLPLLPGVRLTSDDPVERILARTWRPSLTVTAADGLPSLAHASNVVRSGTTLRLSLRLPPTVAAERALQALGKSLGSDPPEGARVSLEVRSAADGWSAPPTAPWLEHALARASRTHFGRPHASAGDGGTIPFARMLAERCPTAQFLVTGVLGPASNAHGPNEFLELATAERLTACLAEVLVACGAARHAG